MLLSHWDGFHKAVCALTAFYRAYEKPPFSDLNGANLDN